MKGDTAFHHSLTDEVREHMRLADRQAELLFAQRDALHQKRHVVGQDAHGLQSLFVLRRLSGLSAMDAVPVLAGRDRHAADRKVFVQLIKGCGASASSGDGDAGADLHRLVKGGAVKQPVQTSDQRGVG